MTVNFPKREARLALAHQLRQLVVDDLHDLLAGRQALEDLLAERLLAHARDEVADDGEVDVGLEQREPDLAHRARDRLFVELALLRRSPRAPAACLRGCRTRAGWYPGAARRAPLTRRDGHAVDRAEESSASSFGRYIHGGW